MEVPVLVDASIGKVGWHSCSRHAPTGSEPRSNSVIDDERR